MKINNYYDVVVVGAGPAGSTAARFVAGEGISVLVLEKDREIGLPVRCAEAVSHEGIAEFLEPEDYFISAEIDTMSFIAPNGTRVDMASGMKGYVLDRTRFDKRLAEIASEKGAQFLTNAYVFGLLFENDKVSGVKFEHYGETYEVKAKVVIAADGVESRVGRWAGLKTHVDFREMEGAYQVLAINVEINPSAIAFYFGENIAPQGYLWVFPKGENKANIGLGIGGEKGKYKSAKKYLDEFLQAHFPNASILSDVAGGVPCVPTLDKIAAPGIILVGDAARQVNPLSGGGIASGMIGGMIGGKTVAEAIKNGSLNHIFEYEKRWNERLGKRHKIFNKIKDGIFDFSDKKFNSLAKTFSKIPYEKRTLGNLFKHALIDNPSLLLDVAKVFL